MKKKLHFFGNKCVLFLLVFYSFTSYGQSNLGPAEAGFTIAPCNILGDLGGNHGKGSGFVKDNNIAMTKLMVGAHVSVNPLDWLGLRFEVSHGSLAADDAAIESKGGLEEARKARNQNFKTQLTEGYVAAEIYPTVLLEQDPSEKLHKLRPFFLLGAGVFHFNPQGQDPVTGNWVYLQALHTEGEGFPEYPDRKEYKLTQLNIPIGFGFKYFVTEDFALSLEVVQRKTFTDYIDDVSTNYIDKDLFYKYLPLNTAIISNRMYDKSVGFANRNAGEKRGTSTNNDSYYSAGFKLSFRLGSSDNSFRNSTRCPVIRY